MHYFSAVVTVLPPNYTISHVKDFVASAKQIILQISEIA